MKRIIVIAASIFSAAIVSAQNNGGISSDMLAEISKGYEGTGADKAIKNALATTPINTLAINSENAAMIDTHFSDRVKTKGHTDQKSSGRCWLFTGLNVLRAKMITQHDLGSFTFSQNYVFFYDQLEKANLFLQGIIDTRKLPDDDREVDWLFSNPIGDGGQFTGVSNLITKYGVVPSEVMPETFCANNTAQMRTQIATKLREDGLRLRQAYKKAMTIPDGKRYQKGNLKKERKDAAALENLEKMKIEQLKEIYHILALCLGVPPTEFEWTRYNSKGEFVSTKTYTPKSFYDEFVGADLEGGYIMVMNDPCREYFKTYEIQYDRHVYDGDNWVYLNLPIDRIKEMAIASIKDDTAMYFSCDVGKFFNRSNGVLDVNNFNYADLMGVEFGMDKKERVQTHASGSSHAMTLIAVDLKDGKPVKWMVENSWGPTSGYNGDLIMTDEWFDEYMFRLVVEKKYVPAYILSLMDQKPTLLPAWDPMFLPEE